MSFSFIFVIQNTFCEIYNPPIGIPAPGFGIEETIENVYGADYYTYYIDNTHPDATDDNNPNGTKSKPRKTIPGTLTDLAEGNVIEISGGPYQFSTSARWTSAGTSEKPVFIRGSDPDNRVQITQTRVEIGGKYLILENLELYNNARINIKYSSPNHISVRNCEIHGPEGAATYGSAINAEGDDIVIYKNNIHHNWKNNDIDVHGVHPGVGAKRVWVLENDIHHNSGDAIQACHGCSPPPRYIYIGRNILHEDRENGVDLKYAQDIIVSENILYGYQDASTSDGSAMVLGSDGMPNRTWVLFNEIYDCNNGIRNEETDIAWIIGNKIYDIEGFAIGLEKKSDDLYIIGNTIYNTNLSIDQFGLNEFRLHIYNNIFAYIRKKYIHLNIEAMNIADSSEMCNNLFWQGKDPFYIRWGFGNKKSYASTSDFDGFAGGPNNIIGNPSFTDAANKDFSIQQNSAAVDKGMAHKAYDTFFDMYGIDIKVDCANIIRPQLTEWDIGAYEYWVDTDVAFEQMNIPDEFGLQNYPNPFNPVTTIQFDLPRASQIKLEISNLTGQKIMTLIDDYYSSGTYKIDWAGSDQDNRDVGTGVYFYRLITDYQILTRKMLLIR
jgi:hypothetical protein